MIVVCRLYLRVFMWPEHVSLTHARYRVPKFILVRLLASDFHILHVFIALKASGKARSPNLVILPLIELALHAKAMPQRLGYCAKPNLSPGRRRRLVSGGIFQSL